MTSPAPEGPGGTTEGPHDARPLRVVQWTTGNVARVTVAAVLADPRLELVGCWAWSPDKVGQDAALLCGLADPCGVAATDDVDALVALAPDCVVHTPLHPDVDQLERLLRAGIDVVTTSELLTAHHLGAGVRERLDRAAREGGASLFGSGMNPGYAQLLAAVATGVCRELRHVRVTESVDVSAFAGDANMDDLGWGRPVGDPGHADDVRRAVSVFEDGAHVLAACLGADLDEVVCRVATAAATRDLDLPGRPIAAGTVAGIDVRFVGVLDGQEVLELQQTWVMDAALEPPMPVRHGYRVEVDGSPGIVLDLGIVPDGPVETAADMHAIGMTITGMPVVHAIRHVVAARPGIVTYADLPVPAARPVTRLGAGRARDAGHA